MSDGACPYCLISLPISGEHKKTKQVKPTRFPQWNEYLELYLGEKETKLEIVVMGRETVREEYLGSASLTLSDLTLDETKDVWLDLENEVSGPSSFRQKVKAGQVHLTVCRKLFPDVK